MMAIGGVRRTQQVDFPGIFLGLSAVLAGSAPAAVLLLFSTGTVRYEYFTRLEAGS